MLPNGYHPVTAARLEDFPVAPIAFRTAADGSPNSLGRKYEHLVKLSATALTSADPHLSALLRAFGYALKVDATL